MYFFTCGTTDARISMGLLGKDWQNRGLSFQRKILLILLLYPGKVLGIDGKGVRCVELSIHIIAGSGTIIIK